MDTPLPQREPGKAYRDAASLDETQEIDMRPYLRRRVGWIDTWPIVDEASARAFIDYVQEHPNAARP